MHAPKDWMNPLAITGYSILLTFVLYKLKDTISNPADFLANILIIAGLVSLIAYHVKVYKTHKDETNDATQRQLRLMAHATITSFLVITLSPLSNAKFMFYDWFALVGHSSLFVSVLAGLSQMFGILLLALYFGFAGARKVFLKKDLLSMEALNLVGRTLMFVFFSAAFYKGVNMNM